MSEIEKMYENVGIEPTHYDACALEDKYWNNEELANQYGTLDRYLSFECPYYGQGCYSTCEYAYDKDEYPPFTAEKQIEIVKAISTNHISGKYLGIDRDEIEKEIYLNLCIDGRKYHAHDKDFAVALAGLINSLWQDLTEKEKRQVKGILE